MKIFYKIFIFLNKWFFSFLPRFNEKKTDWYKYLKGSFMISEKNNNKRVFVFRNKPKTINYTSVRYQYVKLRKKIEKDPEKYTNQYKNLEISSDFENIKSSKFTNMTKLKVFDKLFVYIFPSTKNYLNKNGNFEFSFKLIRFLDFIFIFSFNLFFYIINESKLPLKIFLRIFFVMPSIFGHYYFTYLFIKPFFFFISIIYK